MGRAGRLIAVSFSTVICAYLALSIAAGTFLADVALHPARRPLEENSWLESATARPDRPPIQNVSITARDGSVLRAWYLQPEGSNGSSIILLHGVADNREGVSGYAQMFLRHGYAVLMPDSRAHGESGGNIATYGVLERDDINKWGEWLLPRTHGCEYLFGESMGAAIAIQASDQASDLCAVAVEDPFESFREIAYDRIAQQTGMSERLASIVGRPAVEAGLLYAEIRYGVRLADANPLLAIANSRVPTLLITGTADSNIPMRHSIALHHAAPDNSELWIVDGAEHTGAMDVGPREFEQRVVQWFGTHQAPVAN
jgi:uncharacterized protein